MEFCWFRRMFTPSSALSLKSCEVFVYRCKGVIVELLESVMGPGVLPTAYTANAAHGQAFFHELVPVVDGDTRRKIQPVRCLVVERCISEYTAACVIFIVFVGVPVRVIIEGRRNTGEVGLRRIGPVPGDILPVA